MEPNRPSATAMMAHFMRAAHQVVDRHPLIFDDPVALRLVPGFDEAAIRAQTAIWDAPFFRIGRAIFAYRSRFAEDELAAAVAEGVRQYILLGAGLDTFAYRQPPWATVLRIVEVDHPSSQAYKRERLATAGIGVPANLTFGAIDFERQTLMDGLSAAGVDVALPTYVSMLGVTQYLTRAATEATLRAVRTFGAGSRITISAVSPDAGLTGEDLEFARLGAVTAAESGEPFRTFFEGEALRRWLLELRYADVFLLTHEDAAARYFAGRQDGLRVPSMEQLLVARV